MSQCEFKVEEVDGGWKYTCLSCGFTVTHGRELKRLGRNCSGPMYGNILAVFDMDGKRKQLASGAYAYEYQVAQVRQQDLDAYDGTYTIIKQDASRVGTRLRKMFSVLGFGDKPGCSCGAIREFLDKVDLDYIRSHQPGLVALIAKSAAAVGVKVPLLAIQAALSIAIAFESRVVKNAN